MAVVAVEPGPDDGGGAADRNGDAEAVALRAVVGQELGDLGGVRGVRDVEEVSGARVVAVIVVRPGPDDRDFLSGGATDRDGDAELVLLRAVIGEELGDLEARGGVEEVSRAGSFAIFVVAPCPDDDGGAADRYGVAEFIKRRAVIRQELGNLIAEVGVGRCFPANEA